jgi:2-methylisocitrate lyase-like PEP mutase family enzyme
MLTRNLKEHLDTARDRVRRAREAGADRLFALRVQALERADDALDRVDELPAVGRVASAVATVVERRLERLATVPVDGWAELNAKKAIQAVKELDRTGLRAARLHEARNKERKTVLAAIDGALVA